MTSKKVGLILQKAREERSMSVLEVSREIHIRSHHLKSLEDGEFGKFSSAAQIKGFLRSYADFLELKADDLFKALTQSETLKYLENESMESDNQGPLRKTESTSKLIAEIYIEVGESLKNRRDLLGLALPDIEEYTRIPERYIIMMESGEFDRFPSPVQARGMLGNYVSFLDLDEHSIMMRYADALQVRLQPAQEEEQKPKRAPIEINIPKLPEWASKYLSTDILTLGIIGIGILGFMIWGLGQIITTQTNTPTQPTAPSLADVLVPQASQEATITSAPQDTSTPGFVDAVNNENPDATLEVTLPPFDQESVQLFIIVRQRTYMKISVDGNIEFDGRVQPGTNYSFSASQQIELLTGNAAGLQIFYNDRDMGPLGIVGEVISIIYSLNEIVTPTIAASPTIDPTLFTSTPTLENTPLPTTPQP